MLRHPLRSNRTDTLWPDTTLFRSFPVDLAIALTGVVHFFNNLFKLALVGRQADRWVTIRVGVPAVIAAFFGAWLMLRMSNLPLLFCYRSEEHTSELQSLMRI